MLSVLQLFFFFFLWFKKAFDIGYETSSSSSSSSSTSSADLDDDSATKSVPPVASAGGAVTKRKNGKPIRLPPIRKPTSPTANVILDFSSFPSKTSPGGVNGTIPVKKVISGGGLRRLGSGRKKSTSGLDGFGVVAGKKGASNSDVELEAEEVEEDEVDETIRRFNEQLRAMIKEGRDALKSRVEVFYDEEL